MKETIKLLICDDHPVVRSGLRGMLESQTDLEVVAEATDGNEAIEFARRYRPDVVLMDLRMPDTDGVTATERIRSENPVINVLILTTYETDADVTRAVAAGALGFLLKDAPEERIFGAIRDVARGTSPLSPSVATRLVERMRGNNENILSSREVEILQLVSRGVNNKGIANELWISEATVKSHLNRVFDKLDVVDRTSAVTTALKRGIIRLE
ncbi:MAG: response regulator transcription factor [Actinomycetota bacterium]|jgi:DNA-binding NarL/FixJ family response regulator|nr:response regulator transcription factor [Actinomycetota bacterium]MDP9484649.1 response regulator transcription factor [Actinomycetota bacterium]